MRLFSVMSEIALSMVLLTGAGLTAKAFLRLSRVDPGFNPGNLLTLRVDLPSYKYSKNYQRKTFYQQVVARIEAIPEVRAAGAIKALPLSDGIRMGNFTIEGRPAPAPSDKRWAIRSTITPGYFHAMHIPLLKGRHFTDQDTSDSTLVTIINERLAHRYWPGENPIGMRMRFEDTVTSGEHACWLKVVGVVRDLKNRGVDTEPLPQAYVPHAQDPAANMTVVVRSASQPLGLTAAVEREIWAVDKDQPVYDVMSMERLLSDDLGGIRVFVWLLGILAAGALVLAATGIYGVMSYAVSRRTHEIGLRMALGAQQDDILKLIMKRGTAITCVGVIFGIGGAFALTRFMRSLLFGVSPTDPITFVGVSLFLAAAALLAIYLPGRRATRVDPIASIRCE